MTYDDPTNFADAEHAHDCISSDDRPRAARRLDLTQEQFDDAMDDLHVYDRATGCWS